MLSYVMVDNIKVAFHITVEILVAVIANVSAIDLGSAGNMFKSRKRETDAVLGKQPV